MTLLDFKPMNAKKLTIAEAVAKCKCPVLEPKWDGWRFVIYITESGPRAFTRTGNEYTDRVPTEILAELARFPVGTILDGEMVDLNDQDCTAVVRQFGKSKAPVVQEESDKISFVVFDILQIGDEDVTAKPASERRDLYTAHIESRHLDRVVPTVQIALDGVAHEPVEYAEVIYSQLIGQGYEGIMIKDADAKYLKGKRGHGWFKIKAVEEIDVIVMDMALDGKGQHLGKVGRFQVGQYDEDGKLVPVAWVNPIDDAMRLAMTLSLETPPERNPFYGRVLTIKHYGKLKDGYRHPTCISRDPWREDKPASDCRIGN